MRSREVGSITKHILGRVNFMTIKQPVINTFNRVGINYQLLQDRTEKMTVQNRFGGGSCETTPLIAYLIGWVYDISNQYEAGNYQVKVADFDRVRYFILAEDQNAYYTCID